MKENEIALVPATLRHEDALWHMLTYAATMTEPTEQAISKAKTDPYLRTYVENFGSYEGDLGIVAEQPDGMIIGAAWLRRSHEHDSFRVGGSELPELAMGLFPSYRGRGIGTRMLGTLLDAARNRYSAVALSVRETSPAYRMYLRFGFVETGRMENRVGGTSISMQLALIRIHTGV